MYVVRHKDRPTTTATMDYFRTLEEAEERVARGSLCTTDGEGKMVTLSGPEFLEIVELDRDSKPCRFCGEEVQANDPNCDYCRGCFYGGRTHDEWWPQIHADLKSFECVDDDTVGVWHTGGGCFAIGAVATIGGKSYEILVASDAAIPDPAEEPDATFGACLMEEEEGSGWQDGDVHAGDVKALVQNLIDRAKYGLHRDF